MRLLVINFEMDELSLTMNWSQQVVNLLARSVEKVVVLTSRVGLYDAPPNVEVHVIPRRPLGIPQRLGSGWLMNAPVYRLLRQQRIDACFIHMAIVWAYQLAPALKLFRIPTLVWYAHGAVTAALKSAHWAADRVVTSSPEGFRLPSNKVHVVGQGVDVETFRLVGVEEPRTDILAVSRISPRKRIDLLLDVMHSLRDEDGALPFRLRLIGAPVTPDDQRYEVHLRNRIWREDLQEHVDFVGFVPLDYIPSYYRRAFLHMNVSKTGSMDKTVVEALASGCPVLTSNEAFRDLLAAYPEFVINDDRPDAIARQVKDLYARRGSYDRHALRSLIVGRHDVYSYVDRVLNNLRELAKA